MTVRQRVAGLVVAALGIFAVACTGPFDFGRSAAANLPDYGKVPAFTMTNSHGTPFRGEELRGEVWVADFIYTNCPAECPRMTSQMHRLEKRLEGESDVRLVSFSVDPQRDTPQALEAFAHRYGGPTRQWMFLTGSPATVHLIAYQTFHVGDVIGKIEHSTKFILVDKHGEIRGYYSSFDPDDFAALLKDVRILRNARP